MVRNAVFSGLIGVLLAVAGSGLAADQDCRAIVLVHGAWVGPDYWHPIATRLAERGFSVIRPDLQVRGPAPRTAADDADAVTGAVDQACGRVTLVAHSYGARPAIAAWDQRRDKVAGVVIIEGVAPAPGSPVAVAQDDFALNWLEQNAAEIFASGLWPAPQELVARFGDGVRAQSIGPLYAQITLKGGTLPDIPRLYVTAQDSAAPIFAAIATEAGAAGWRLGVVPGGHDIASGAADEIAALIAEFAEGL